MVTDFKNKSYNSLYTNILNCCVVAVISFFIYCAENPVSSTKNRTLHIGFFAQRESYYDPIIGYSLDSNNIDHYSYTLSRPMAKNVAVYIDNDLPDILWNSSYTTGGFEASLMEPYCYTYAGIENKSIYFTETFKDSITANVVVDCDSGSCEVAFPTPADITSHALYDTVSLDSNIIITWTGKADWYFAAVTLIDSSSCPKGGFDTCITQKILEVPKGIIEAWVARISVSITSTNGPLPAYGTIGNLTGDINGFIYSYCNVYDSTVNTYSSIVIKNRKCLNETRCYTPLPSLDTRLQSCICRKLQR